MDIKTLQKVAKNYLNKERPELNLFCQYTEERKILFYATNTYALWRSQVNCCGNLKLQPGYYKINVNKLKELPQNDIFSMENVEEYDQKFHEKMDGLMDSLLINEPNNQNIIKIAGVNNGAPGGFGLEMIYNAINPFKKDFINCNIDIQNINSLPLMTIKFD